MSVVTTSRVLWKKQPALLVTDCTSVHDAIHKEGTAPSSTHKPLAVELAIFEITGHGRRSRLEVDRRTVPDCSLSHQARIEEVRRGITTSIRSRAVEKTAGGSILETRRSSYAEATLF